MQEWGVNKSILVGLVLLVSFGAGGYVWFNLRSHGATEVVDQSGLDEVSLIEEIQDVGDETVGDVVVQQSEDKVAVSKVSMGEFVYYDPAHFASGKAVVYETGDGPVLKLEDFATNNGPDLFVYLGTEGDLSGIKSDRGETVSLGKLKQIKGDQVYKLPSDYEKYGSVVIWCRAFDINFSSASLESI